MDKMGKKTRDINFYSKKNQKLICVHNQESREYAKILEDDPKVISYEACYKLDKERYQFVNPLDVRKDYFEVEWTSDFVLTFEDCSIGVREVIKEYMLSKRASIEKLEFSRRYWAASETAKNWKIVIMERKGE